MNFPQNDGDSSSRKHVQPITQVLKSIIRIPFDEHWIRSLSRGKCDKPCQRTDQQNP